MHSAERAANTRASNRVSGDVMTSEDVAEYLKMHVRTVNRLFEKGELPAVKIGVKWRTTRANLDKKLQTK